MKNYAIPAILGFAIIAAGVFAFSPIEQATAVHISIVNDLELSIPALIAENGAVVIEPTAGLPLTITNFDEIVLDCGDVDDYLIQDITLDMADGFATDVADEADLTIDGTDMATQQLSAGATALLDGGVGASAGEDTTVELLTNEDGDEVLENIRFTLNTNADVCTATINPP